MENDYDKEEITEEEITEEERVWISLGLNENEQRLLRQTSRHVSRIPYIFIMMGFIVYVWIRFFELFTQDVFFLIYNIAVYGLLVGMAILSSLYQRKADKLLSKLITIIQNNPQSEQNTFS
jgi:low affinity Fe/Cu permease